ncbi:MAG: guanylate kinase [Candidatus Aminicenantes bacterium]|nr:guanylate kinase [Candidatus Aminicenantes bacterium]NIM83023.1 guanylate kinase [Candidatus Aminicenantes bacterium]NIN22410.1 guanylate kinase [Candidatus Aminicenantes bacterium]NIN46178.1 guanylate kinase [Candidatus Aminicenantes bacterium]NIN89015.1 guanylate kinase [Candidatus Aminicenantes bacterium]
MSNNIIVISGPSGSGKSTLIDRLMAQHPEIIFSTSHTTRPLRGRERDGEDYYFVSEKQFLQMAERGEFVEWAKVYEDYYGTSYKEIETKTKTGKDLVLDIDVQGAGNIKKKYPDALFILVAPPSMEELRNRLVEREQKIDPHIEKRLEIAREELSQYDIYDYIVINDNLEDAFAVLNAIYIAFRNTISRHETFMKQLVEKSGGKR